jgi:hypothetical protein
MKPKTVLKSVAAFSPEVLEPDGLVQDNLKPSPADAETQRENQLYVAVAEHPGLADYRHWGLNE